jgi:hypothetical protein
MAISSNAQMRSRARSKPPGNIKLILLIAILLFVLPLVIAASGSNFTGGEQKVLFGTPALNFGNSSTREQP